MSRVAPLFHSEFSVCHPTASGREPTVARGAGRKYRCGLLVTALLIGACQTYDEGHLEHRETSSGSGSSGTSVGGASSVAPSPNAGMNNSGGMNGSVAGTAPSGAASVDPVGSGASSTGTSSSDQPSSATGPLPSDQVSSGLSNGAAAETSDATQADSASDSRSPGDPAQASSGEAAAEDSETEPQPPNDPPAVGWPVINGVQWADTDGKPIQAHGGGVLQVGDDYYWFGENRNADSTFFAVSAYRSRDLIQWEHAHDVLTMNSDPGLKPANVERPKVVYNATTKKYVMWMHWENGRDYGEARAAVASSDSVDGDYTYHGSFRPLQGSGVVDHDKPGYMSRDCTLFVDDDGRGYFISASNENYDLHLYSLSEDYLSVVSRAALLFEGGHREAPALFKRGDTYFLLTSGSTGWSPNQAQYASSKSLTSGWSALRNVGDANTFYSQSTFVLPVTGSQGTQYLYMGDRWAGAWSGRVNDSSYVWQPVTFPSDSTMNMSWTNNLQLDARRGEIAGSVDAFTFSNKKSGMMLAVDGAPTENGADLVQSPAATALNATWRLNYDGAGHFRITNEAGQKIIDVPDESTSAGTRLHLWDSNGGDHQVWGIVDLGNGDFQLRNKKSGLYLGVVAGSVSAAAQIEQQAAGGDEQVWQIRAVPETN